MACPHRLVFQLPASGPNGFDADGARARIAAMLLEQHDCDHGNHVLNLTGLAATGKTRLALDVAKELELSGVVALLRLPARGHSPAGILDSIPKARPILLILEEADQLRPSDQDELIEVLQQQDGLHAILTSQRPLPLAGGKAPTVVRV